MEDQLFKIALNNGALMMFFIGILWAAYKWLPSVFATTIAAFKDMVAALNASTNAIGNASQIISANSDLMKNHMNALDTIRDMWDEMRERIDTFQCPIAHSHTDKPQIALKQDNVNA